MASLTNQTQSLYRTLVPEISVIIVNFNAGDRLEKCLKALDVQSYRDFEVIVIDNGSADDSISAIKQGRAADTPVHLIEAGENLGFAAGNNRAVKRARGNWLAFLNPDAYPSPDWLASMMAGAERWPDVSAFGSTQLDAADPTKIDGAGDVFHVFGIPYRGHFGWPTDMLPATGECFSPCAAGALYKRSVFEALGGFDERFFCYGEDVDLGFRLRLMGERSVQLREAVILHEGSAVSGRYSDFTVYHGNRNKIWATYKSMPGVLYWPLLPFQLAANFYLLARSFTVGIGPSYWRALRDGFGGLGQFREDRRLLQRERKVSIRELAKVMTWSPLKVSKREADLRPVDPLIELSQE